VGWGGSTLAGHSTPAVTTLAVPLRELGTTAVDELLAVPKDPPATPPEPVTLDVTLVARATTARARSH
jgi:DNA-binding LacI/PurR family transcriptional regulator